MDQSNPVDVYIFCSMDGGPGYMTFHLMDPSGEVHGSHICSHISFALGDLYMHRPERQKFLSEKYPQGYQVWVLPVGCFPPKSVMDRNLAMANIVETNFDG